MEPTMHYSPYFMRDLNGAKVDQVKTKHGSLMMVMGNTPELVGEIQAWAQRTNDEMKKMEEMEMKMMKGKKEKEIKKIKKMKTEKKTEQE